MNTSELDDRRMDMGGVAAARPSSAVRSPADVERRLVVDAELIANWLELEPQSYSVATRLQMLVNALKLDAGQARRTRLAAVIAAVRRVYPEAPHPGDRDARW